MTADTSATQNDEDFALALLEQDMATGCHRCHRCHSATGKVFEDLFPFSSLFHVCCQ